MALLTLEKKIEGLEGYRINYNQPTEMLELPEIPLLLEENHKILLTESEEFSLEKLEENIQRVDALEKKIEDFKEKKLDFDQKLATFNEQLRPFKSYITGYGMKPVLFGYLGYNDGTRKSLIAYNTKMTLSWEQKNNTFYFIASSLGTEYNKEQARFKDRPLQPYEGATRPGYSGGACVNEEGELLAICHGSSIPFNMFYSSQVDYALYPFACLSEIFLYGFTKYLSALGIPVPGVTPWKGTMSAFINLSVHKDWIENNRK
jgi:hypothetical protein